MPSAPPNPPPDAVPRGGRASLRALASRPAVHALLVALAAALVGANTLDAPFVMDDWSAFVSNATTRDLAAWLGAFHWTWNRAFGDLSFALNRELGGLDPPGFHVVNVALHAGAALLVWRLAGILLGLRAGAAGETPGAGRGAALAAGLLFAVHPVQTGAVTYVAQRYAVLATLLYVATVALYLAWRLRPGPGRARHLFFGAALACAVLAMRSKEIAFTLPLVLVVAEVALLDGPPRSRALALAPFLATLALIPAALVVSSGSLSAASGQDPFVQALGKAPLSRVEYLLTQLRVIPTYLRLLVLPVDQTFDYDFPVEHGVSPAVLASASLLAAVLAAGIVLLVRGRRDAPRARVAGFGIVWFLIALSVESSVVPIDDVINEHRVYLPSVGFALATAAGLAALAEWLRPRWRPATGVIAAGAAAWILGLAVAAHLRNEVWGDSVGFWRDAVEKAPRKPRTWVNLGVALGDAGRLDEAIHAYESALRIDPGQVLARYNLANVYVRMGLVEPAVRHLEALLRRTPGSPATRTTLAGLYVRQGRQDRAEEELLAALRADPSCGPALEALARLRRERAARP